jgi:hypothetical protein
MAAAPSNKNFKLNDDCTGEKFAQAVFPGPVNGLDIDGTSSDSYNNCIQLINNQLVYYGYNGIKPMTDNNMKNILKLNKSFADGHSRHEMPNSIAGNSRTNMLYCGKCMKSAATEDDYFAEVVAKVKFTTVDEGHRKYVSANVLCLYPHSQQCTTRFTDRRNYMYDRENGGAGYCIVPFPTKELLFQRGQLEYDDQQLWSPDDKAETVDELWSPYQQIVNHLQTEGIGGNHGGTKIDNHTSSFQETYPYDERFYLQLDHLDSEDRMHKLGPCQYNARHQKLQLRIVLWYANVMNLPTEIAIFPDFIPFLAKNPEPTIGFYDSQTFGPKNQRHLEMQEPIILFGGKQGERTTVVSDQIIHTDFRTTDDHYAVSTNPRLAGLGKPGSIMIPLSEKGRRIFMAGQHVAVQFGHAIVFQGDCPHAGSTIPSSQFDNHDCRPSLHAYVFSAHHLVDITNFGVEVDQVGLHQPHLLNMLSPSIAIQQCCVLRNNFVTGCTSALSNPKCDKKDLEVEIDKTIQSLMQLKTKCQENTKKDSKSDDINQYSHRLRGGGRKRKENT